MARLVLRGSGIVFSSGGPRVKYPCKIMCRRIRRVLYARYNNDGTIEIHNEFSEGHRTKNSSNLYIYNTKEEAWLDSKENI